MRELTRLRSTNFTALPNSAPGKTKNRHLRLDTCVQMRMGTDVPTTCGRVRRAAPFLNRGIAGE